MPRLVFVVTVPVTASVLLRGQLGYLRDAGYDITVISSPGPELDETAHRERVRAIAVPIAREISPAHDARSLLRLTRVLAQLRPDIVHASTAKAGLLGMLAATAVGVRARVYLLRGLRLETERGAKRAVLATTERLAASCAHEVWCVSESLRAAYVQAGFAPAGKCVVVGSGSSNGVDVARFAPSAARRAEATALRAKLGIAVDAPVIGFIGRPVADKGIRELLEACDQVRARVPAARLVVVGAGFADDRAVEGLADRAGVVLVPAVAEPAPYYAMMDVLAFTSYREGFPNAPLEAAAAEVPVVGVRATGTCDAIVDGQTGTLVTRGDVAGLAVALIGYLVDPKRRIAHGRAARSRVEREFRRELVWDGWRRRYARLLA